MEKMFGRLVDGVFAGRVHCEACVASLWADEPRDPELVKFVRDAS